MGIKLNPFTGKLDVVDSPSGDFSDVELDQGTATAPSISFNGDPNTGIYSPGADQVAISTNGTGRLFVDESGKVGIRMLSRGPQLDIDNRDNNVLTDLNDIANYQVAIQRSLNNNGDSVGIGFGISDGNSIGASIYHIREGTSSIGSLCFATSGTGGTTTERVRIDANGRVGIGSASPSNKLEIANGSDSDTIVFITGADESSEYTALGVGPGYGSLTAGGAGSTSTDLVIRTANAGTEAERLRITSDGKLGLGTSSPSGLLHLQTTSTNVELQMLENNGSTAYGASLDAFNALGGNLRIRLHDSGGTYQERFRITSTGNVGIGTTGPLSVFDCVVGAGSTRRLLVNYDDSVITVKGSNDGSNPEALRLVADNLRINTGVSGSGSEAARIDSSGRVGIGTTSPARNLHINGADSDTVQVHLTNSTTGGTANDGFSLALGSDESGILNMRESNPMRFLTSDTERMRIDSSGRLLVGTSSARANFFNSTATAGLQLEGVNYTEAGLAIICNNGSAGEVSTLTFAKSDASSVGSNTLVASGDNLGYVSFQGNDGSEFVEAANIKAQVDGTPGANDMPGRLVFSVTADGSASPTEAMRIKNTRVINFSNAPVYADNAAAKTGGLVDGDVYRTSTGDLKIVYT